MAPSSAPTARVTPHGTASRVSSTGCESLSIPQAACFDACTASLTEASPSQNWDAATDVVYFSNNPSVRGKPCCPDMVGAVSLGTYTADLPPVDENVGAGRAIVVPVSRGVVRLSFIDGNAKTCQNLYTVTSGNVAGVVSVSGADEAAYGPSYSYIWAPILAVFLLSVIVAVIYRRRVAQTLHLAEPKLEHHDAEGGLGMGDYPPAHDPAVPVANASNPSSSAAAAAGAANGKKKGRAHERAEEDGAAIIVT